jgi:hypothetical protein
MAMKNDWEFKKDRVDIDGDYNEDDNEWETV